MELVWATEDFLIAGQPYTGFPVLLWDSMESCIPANQFFRHYLLRGAIGSKPYTQCERLARSPARSATGRVRICR